MARFFSVADALPYLAQRFMYERQAVTDLWTKLTEVAKKQWKWRNVSNKRDELWEDYFTNKRMLQVYGPPGSGKSSATFQWAWEVCRNIANVQCLWINCATNADGQCWKMSMNIAEGKVKMEQHELPSSRDGSYFNQIAVFDGLRLSTVEVWRNLMNTMARDGVAVIAVSSEGVSFHAGDSQDIIQFEHFVPSWIKLEYYDACSNDKFWRSVCRFIGGNVNDEIAIRTRLIDTKFEVAGHSARFMFSFDEVVLTHEITKFVETLGRDISSLEEAVSSNRSVGAVNSLVARIQYNKNGVTPEHHASFPTEEDVDRVAVSLADVMPTALEVDEVNCSRCVVSTLATTLIVAKFGSDIEKLRSLAKILDNKAIEGYAAEEQLKKSLYLASELVNGVLSLDIDDQTVQLPVTQLICCNSDLVLQNLHDHCQDNTWFFVCKNQGAFNAIHVVSKSHIRFVQVTVGKSHSFLLDIVPKLLLDLLSDNDRTWTHVEFLVMRPETEKGKKFCLDPVRGSIQKYWDRKDYRNTVRYAFLPWGRSK